jgi:murein DD-endopeptidase MepM/ murein hydrolase activator NlpD
MKKLLCLTLIFVLAFSTVAGAESKSLAELRKERDAINAKVKNTQSSLGAAEAERYQTQLAILDLDEKLTIAYDDLETITTELVILRERLTQAETELEQAKTDRDAQMAAYKDRLRVMYMYGELHYLDVLFATSDIHDFLVQVEYQNAIAEHDQQLVDKLTAAEDNVSVKVEEIARQRNTIQQFEIKQTELTQTYEAALVERREYIEQLEKDIEKYTALLEQEKADQAAVSAKYTQAEKAYQAELARLAAERRAREEAAAAEAIANFNGSMGWPVPSSHRITSHFGGRKDPIHGRWDDHSGVDISAAGGSDIVASESGVVTLAERWGTYGNCVVVSHGGGISTLYAHASKILVGEGQTVAKGQVIARIGTTGRSTGNHLHYEVQVNGRAVNPKKYLGY